VVGEVWVPCAGKNKIVGGGCSIGGKIARGNVVTEITGGVGGWGSVGRGGGGGGGGRKFIHEGTGVKKRKKPPEKNLQPNTSRGCGKKKRVIHQYPQTKSRDMT